MYPFKFFNRIFLLFTLSCLIHKSIHEICALPLYKAKQSLVTCTPEFIIIRNAEVELRRWSSLFVAPITLDKSIWEPYNTTSFCETDFKFCATRPTNHSQTIFWESDSSRQKTLPLNISSNRLFNALTEVTETLYTVWVAAKTPERFVAFLKTTCLCETSPRTSSVISCQGTLEIGSFYYWKKILTFVKLAPKASTSVISVEWDPLAPFHPNFRQTGVGALNYDAKNQSKLHFAFSQPSEVRLKFKTEVKTTATYGIGYPNYCYLTLKSTRNQNHTNIPQYTEIQDSINAKIPSSTFSSFYPMVYVIKNGCPTSSKWNFRIEKVETYQQENEFTTQVIASFSLAGLPQNLLKNVLVETHYLGILCNIDVTQKTISKPSEVQNSCKDNAYRRSLKKTNLIEKSENKYSRDETTGSLQQDEDEIVQRLMKLNDRFKTYNNKTNTTNKSIRYSKILPEKLNKIQDINVFLKTKTDQDTSLADSFNSHTTNKPCNPDITGSNNASYYIVERYEDKQILRCSKGNFYIGPFNKILVSSIQDEMNLLRKSPLGTVLDLKEASKLVGDDIPLLQAKTITSSITKNKGLSRKTNVLNGSIEKQTESADDDHQPYTIHIEGKIQNSSSAEELGFHVRHSFRSSARNFQAKQQRHQRRSLQNENSFFSQDNESGTNTSAEHLPTNTSFRLRNYFYVPKVPREENLIDVYNEAYNEQIEQDFYNYLQTLNSNFTTQNVSDQFANASGDTSEGVKNPEFIHAVRPYEDNQADISVEPPNRGFFGIGRYVPQAQSSIYKYINQISYGPWFVKWGRNKLEKASQVIVASDAGFVDAGVSGTQKEVSIGGGRGKLTGGISYNEIRQETAVSLALGNFGVKVDRSQTYNATALEVFARSFQSSTLINFVDRSFGQRIRIRDFEISVQHDFDDYFYPSDPGYGTEFLVQYKGASFAIANDIAQRKLGISVGARGHSVAVLHDFNQYVSEIQANWGKSWQLSFGWDFPDMYSQSVYAEAGFGRLNRAFVQVGGGIGDDGVPQASAQLKTRNIGINIDFLYEFGQRTMQYAFTVGRFSYIWQANIDLSAVRIPTFLGIRPGDVEHLFLSLLPQSVEQ